MWKHFLSGRKLGSRVYNRPALYPLHHRCWYHYVHIKIDKTEFIATLEGKFHPENHNSLNRLCKLIRIFLKYYLLIEYSLCMSYKFYPPYKFTSGCNTRERSVRSDFTCTNILYNSVYAVLFEATELCKTSN